MPRRVSSSASLDDRDDQPLVVEVDGDAQVDLVVHDQRVVAHRGVEVRELVQRLDHGPGDEGQVGEREALLGLELRAVRRAAPARPARSRPRAPPGCGRDVAFDRTMCSAVRRRMLVKGMISSVPAVARRRSTRPAPALAVGVGVAGGAGAEPRPWRRGRRHAAAPGRRRRGARR